MPHDMKTAPQLQATAQGATKKNSVPFANHDTRTQAQKELGDIALAAIAECEKRRRNRRYLHTNKMWTAAEAIADTLGMTVDEILANQEAAADAYAWARILPDDPDWQGVAA